MAGMDFLGGDEASSKDAKWNIFKFQDHLKDMIELCAEYRIHRKYRDLYEALTTLYMRARPFFDDKEKKEVDGIFNSCKAEYNKLIGYDNNYKTSNFKMGYNPQTALPDKLEGFEFKILDYMGKHNLLMMVIRKGQEGAASQ